VRQAPIAQWIERSPPEAEAQVRVLVGVSKRTDLESHPEAVEQFLAMLCFEKRDELAELPIDIVSEFGKGGSR
jgi:hypothetical protein